MMKNKELITLREKKLLNGSRSLYLDYSIDGIRRKEYLKMYLVPETRRSDRMMNERTLEAATMMKTRRTVELYEGAAGIEDKKKNKDQKLLDYLDKVIEDYTAQGKTGTASCLDTVRRRLLRFSPNTTLRSINHDWLKRLLAEFSDVSQMTRKGYWSLLSTVLSKAVQEGILKVNPMLQDKSLIPRMPECEREYLTYDEVESLAETPCHVELTKQAFMFSCFTGLRFSDIRNLSWGMIKKTGGGKLSIEIRQIKTHNIVTVPLTENAIEFLPEKSSSNADGPFSDMRRPSATNKMLKIWAKEAGIEKRITFHTARHTFATMLLTFGADIYTASKLLGHTNITTTQIYAKIVDKKRIDAVEAIPCLHPKPDGDKPKNNIAPQLYTIHDDTLRS